MLAANIEMFALECDRRVLLHHHCQPCWIIGGRHNGANDATIFELHRKPPTALRRADPVALAYDNVTTMAHFDFLTQVLDAVLESTSKQELSSLLD